MVSVGATDGFVGHNLVENWNCRELWNCRATIDIFIIIHLMSCRPFIQFIQTCGTACTHFIEPWSGGNSLTGGTHSVQATECEYFHESLIERVERASERATQALQNSRNHLLLAQAAAAGLHFLPVRPSVRPSRCRGRGTAARARARPRDESN